MESSSRSARMVAAYRARASERTKPVCSDPFARSIAGEQGFADAETFDRSAPQTELFVGLRTAFLDAETQRRIAEGFRQVVVLGAGLDSRAGRLPGAKYYEVDHPATQKTKRELVASLPGYPKDAATYVSCDFERDDFVEQLWSTGFDAQLPTLILWEGVTYYLTEKAVRATLRQVATAFNARTVISFDHMGKKMGTGALREETSKATFDRIAQMGEPLRFGTDDALPILFEEGFRRVKSWSFDELALERTGTYDRGRKFRYQRMVVASVESAP